MQHRAKTKPDAAKDELIEAWSELQAQKAQEACLLLKKAAIKSKG